jgi:hypothetical protein
VLARSFNSEDCNLAKAISQIDCLLVRYTTHGPTLFGVVRMRIAPESSKYFTTRTLQFDPQLVVPKTVHIDGRALISGVPSGDDVHWSTPSTRKVESRNPPTSVVDGHQSREVPIGLFGWK